MNPTKPSPTGLVVAVTASTVAAGLTLLALVYTVLTHRPLWATGIGGAGVFLIMSAGGIFVDRALTTWLHCRDTRTKRASRTHSHPPR